MDLKCVFVVRVCRCVCVCEPGTDRQKDHMFPLSCYQPALNAHRMSFACIIYTI